MEIKTVLGGIHTSSSEMGDGLCVCRCVYICIPTPLADKCMCVYTITRTISCC